MFELISKKITMLKEVVPGENSESYSYLIGSDESVLLEYKSSRDIVVFTTEKIILVDVQGVMGKKKEWLVLPYSKATSFSIETAGTFDIDAECKLWSSGIGCVELNFKSNTDIKRIATILVTHIK